MDDREIEGVVAHELGHVLHGDILISSVAATIAAAIMFISALPFGSAAPATTTAAATRSPDS
jgi:heat shock protein HtpX